MSIISLNAVLRPAAPGPCRSEKTGQTLRGAERKEILDRDLHPAPIAFIVIDSVMWFLGLWAASALRLETLALTANLTLDGSGTPLVGLLLLTAIAVAVYTLLGRAVRLHQGRHLVGSFDEMPPLAGVVAATAVMVTATNAVWPERMLPMTAPVIAAPLVIVAVASVRYLVRLLAVRALRALREAEVQPSRALIVGAGDVGRALADSMQRDPSSTWDPVGYLEDDPRKRHFRHAGVSVVGSIDQLHYALERTGADILVIATSHISADTMGTLTAAASELDLPVKIVPPLNEMIDGVHHADLREIQPADLLGRRQVDTDLSTINSLLRGKSVLVTGAGGSIGSELCRQISKSGPKELVMLDRDESALHALLLTMGGTADLGNGNMELADIRDAARLDAVFARHKPDIVFHAAALKHVNMLEKSPDEAFKTNVLGTHNVLEASHRHGVERFVNISTDKAADPHNVLGYSKRIAEGLTAHKGRTAGHGTWLSVRFGNVLATRGSVIHTFIAQIEQGGPVTVTDPEVTRFFMTVSEAVQLVLQASVVGESGGALVLDMGRPVPIVQLAQQLIDASGKEVEIVFSGLRPGEKLHEDLFAPGEDSRQTSHPLIRGVPVVPVSYEELPDPRSLLSDAQIRDVLTTVCEAMEATRPPVVRAPIAVGF
ncbi:nucleoside-diphosphate sugar epimerase/dehydratase [Brachybacterium paraconglomeratum]|uniref:nucleoside-diphosphate sugar epimerase/dehydratase n=1 Tax=Brachybacterium paraconglomeratum TaxID=173362 RepID=UPI0021A6EBAB|nr:nucleoside-diphosphate sugar epimerase/dehydratase [Brachybacterium paraconglomeratum]MCT1908742.1 polysaccharide biosynthesis protein [Brachybacterium paraconglomeratum]